ncbi:hypothetical protein [Mangrovimonas sp. YM274]|uniref:hypothetical protein n=1 Tax=Mangrovimonas sp. YM274 TaxID=3070660 RepID=UPI0027DC4965|nr:hypothetical protein [Mangrovimonas sp. YM274]WMI69364.1 hypothetical protein RBH95_03070 [Mangrovimonas sp. YM274]
MKLRYFLLGILLIFSCSNEDDESCTYEISYFEDCQCTYEEQSCLQIAFIYRNELERLRDIYVANGNQCVYVESIRTTTRQNLSGYIKKIPDECFDTDWLLSN